MESNVYTVVRAGGVVLGEAGAREGYPMNIDTILMFVLQFSCVWSRLGKDQVC